MLVLSLDTSTNQGGLAILRGTDVLARRVWTREKSHSEMLTATLEETLQEAGVAMNDVNLLAVGKGPGSFTGIRIAINAARTLAYTLSIAVRAYDTNEILAHGVPVSSQPLVTLVNAHKNLIYGSRFEARNGIWVRTHGPDAWNLEELDRMLEGPHLCVGDGYLEFETTFPSPLKSKLIRPASPADFPSPEVLGRLAANDPSAPLVWNEVQALYIRASEAEEKLRERLQARPED